MNKENPFSFWSLLANSIMQEDWEQSAKSAARSLEGLFISFKNKNYQCILEEILFELQFGPEHFQLSPMKSAYYKIIRPILPVSFRPLLKKLLSRRLEGSALLNWPIEDRYIQYQFHSLNNLLQQKGLGAVEFIHFWPDHKRYAFVLTHDVESAAGLTFIKNVAEVEEKYGFRSSFNFVPQDYNIDLSILNELRARGFEVGVHGLTHDGSLFSSKAVFLEQALQINQVLKKWGSVGFRSPLTHRNPEWMQALEIEYDSSFFDTDPFEPIPGGTMSIWPFFMGHFVELPYTLVQDHTLMVTLNEKSPRLWIEKVDFIEKYHGMALLNSHPDYLRAPGHLEIYEEFLSIMKERQDYWHALPKDTAAWWRQRAQAKPELQNGAWVVPNLREGTIGKIEIMDHQLFIDGCSTA